MNRKKILTKYILFFIIFLIAPCTVAKEFKDIPHGFWAYREIDSITNENIMNGYSNGMFLPSKLLTRAEFASITIKALKQENLPIEKIYTFDDINVNHWAYNDIQRAINLGIIKPADENHFCPNNYITRSEIITFLVNLLKTENITKEEAIIALQNAYTDFEDIPDWFKVTAGKAEAINVIAKEPPRQNYLDYDKYVSRAQAAVFFANMKRETDSYIAEKIKEETSPKIAEGIIIDNVIQNQDVVTINAKTVLPVMISGQISSENNKAGEMFKASFAGNIVDYQHHLLLSKDIVLIGKILDVTKGKNFVRNGELIFELSCINNKNILTKILAYAENETPKVEGNVFKKAAKSTIKGRDFIAKDGQIIYIKLLKPIRVNIVTGEVFD